MNTKLHSFLPFYIFFYVCLTVKNLACPIHTAMDNRHVAFYRSALYRITWHRTAAQHILLLYSNINEVYFCIQLICKEKKTAHYTAPYRSQERIAGGEVDHSDIGAFKCEFGLRVQFILNVSWELWKLLPNITDLFLC